MKNRLVLAISLSALSMLSCAIPVATVTAVTGVPTVAPTATKQPTVTPGTTKELLAEVIAFEALHVRAAPGYKSEVVDLLYVGEEVTLTGRCSTDPAGWAQIRWNGSTAWVRAKFLSENKCSEK